MLGGIWPRGSEFPVGNPWYYLGHYDPSVGEFTNATSPQPLDFGPMVIWSTVDVVSDGRMLYVGWFNYGEGALTLPRVVSYDPELKTLAAYPIAELTRLRTVILGQRSTTTVTPTAPLALLDKANGSDAFDLEMNVTLPAGSPAAFRVTVLAASPGDAAVVLDVTITAPATNKTRIVSMSVGVSGATKPGFNATRAFPIPDSDKVAVRVLADR